MCLYPTLIYNPKYKANKKNKGIVPTATDKRVLFIPVGCGNCIECRKQKARHWQIRLIEELKHNKTKPYFVTLTFNPESYNKLFNYVKNDLLNAYETDNKLATRAVRQFLEIWRKHNKTSIKHWLITELGDGKTEHIHLHGLIWTNNPHDIKIHWKHGNVWIGDKPHNYVNNKTINYIIKYVTKTDIKHAYYKPIILCSKGIGKDYLNSYNSKLNIFKGKFTDETYKTPTGHKTSLPIYYRNKLYSDHEREQLWLNLLDKNVRYILGQKINIKHDDQEYYKLLKYSQQLNKRLGYGDNTIDWNKKEYENQRRLLIQLNRGVINQDEFEKLILQFKIYRSKKENCL